MITVGTRVRVKSCSQYCHKYINVVGTVDRISSSSYGVLLDGCINPASSYGCFWFKSSQLEQVSEIDTINVNYKEDFIVFDTMIENDVKCVKVKFANGGSVYSHPVAVYENVEKGDIVVIQTGHHGYAVAIVEEYMENAVATCGREVICKISFREYEERRARRKKLAELSRSMNKRVKELQSLAVFEMLAEKDDALKEMLEEFKNLREGK